jgi:glucan endo-1,3-alpha-glucosidase
MHCYLPIQRLSIGWPRVRPGGTSLPRFVVIHFRLQRSFQCWCGNSLTKSGSVGSTASDSDCDQPCSGDPTQTCGAGNRLQLYSDPPSNDPPPPSSTTSSTSTSKSTSTTTSTTRSSTTTSHTTTTTANSIPSDWSESSCLVDSSSARALGTYHTSTSTNTPATCINTCNSKGYDYAGLEYGEEVCTVATAT